jgi:hypothetical protein
MIEITISVIIAAVLLVMFLALNEIVRRGITRIRTWAYHRKQDKTLRDRIF